MPMATEEEIDQTIAAYVEVVGWHRFGTAPQVSSALRQIPKLARRVLALQGYLRAEHRSAGSVARKWAWTQEEYEQFDGSPEDVVLSDEIREVTRRFNDANPGFRLRRGSEFRPFEEQLRYWNSRDNVGDVADEVLKKVRAYVKKRLKDPDYPTLTGPVSGAGQVVTDLAFRLFQSITTDPLGALVAGGAKVMKLSDALAEFAETVRKASHGELRTATPGISDHGQARAIDFMVFKTDGTKLLGASNAALWRSTGFAAKLSTAMATSTRFHGPLLTPDEPWHYHFEPG